MSAITPNRHGKEGTSTFCPQPHAHARSRTESEIDFRPIEPLTPTPTSKNARGKQAQHAEEAISRPLQHAGNSTSWFSINTQNQAKLRRLQGLALHAGFLTSPFFPKTVQAYTLHLTEWQELVLERQKKVLQQRITAEDEKGGLEARLAAWGVQIEGEGVDMDKEKEKEKEKEKGVLRAGSRKCRKKLREEQEAKEQAKKEKERRASLKRRVGRCMGGWQLENIGVGPLGLCLPGGVGLTTVLARASIWAPGVEDKTRIEWPGREEQKFEGPDRAKQGLPRRLPPLRIGRLDPGEKACMLEQGGVGGETEVYLIETGQTDVPWRKRVVISLGAFDEVGFGSDDKAQESGGGGELDVTQEEVEEGGYAISKFAFDEMELRGRTGWADLLDEL